MDGRTESQTDTEWWHSNLIYCTLNKVIWKFLAQYVQANRRKVRKTVYFQYSKSKNGHYFYKNWCKLTTLLLDLRYSKTKSYIKFQLNISKNGREKCRKLCISSILSSKRGITPKKLTQIDDNRTWSVVQQNKVICKYSAQYNKARKKKSEKLRFFSILSSKRGITPTKIDATQIWSGVH